MRAFAIERHNLTSRFGMASQRQHHMQQMQEPQAENEEAVEQAIDRIVNHQPFEQLGHEEAATDLALHHGHLEDQPGSHLAQLPHAQSHNTQQAEDSHSSPAKKRRRYNNNFKATVLDHLKTSGAKLPAVAKHFDIPENTLREWTKVTVVQSIESARLNHGGTLKANMQVNPMHRLAESLMVFFNSNEKQPPGLRQPTTTKLIVSKGLEARKKLLELHEIQPFLDDKEKKALENFTGSDSWAKKFARRHNLKMSGARVKELAENDAKAYYDQIRQIAQRMKQAGPGYEDVATLLFQAGDKLATRCRTLDAHMRGINNGMV
eukprot:scaffold388_cov114-Cylindrotheca_fusiformis.AAC.23